MNTSTVATNQKPGASMSAIQHHYDVSNDFYRLWLDTNMVYSCALWNRDDEDLETAQLNKLDWHLQQCGIRKGERLLEIGCGWGALLKGAVSRFEAAHATGCTLSEAQARWIRELNLPNVDVRLESWSDHVPQMPYHAIVSIGAFEHFARSQQTDAEKLEGYRSFFAFCHRSLVPGGRLSLQTIFTQKPTREVAPFFENEVFPESELPHLHEIVEASQGLFEIELLHTDRNGYIRTLRCWLNNLRSKKADAIAVAGAETFSRYEKYLDVSALGFRTGASNLVRVAMRRIESKRSRA